MDIMRRGLEVQQAGHEGEKCEGSCHLVSVGHSRPRCLEVVARESCRRPQRMTEGGRRTKAESRDLGRVVAMSWHFDSHAGDSIRGKEGAENEGPGVIMALESKCTVSPHWMLSASFVYKFQSSSYRSSPSAAYPKPVGPLSLFSVPDPPRLALALPLPFQSAVLTLSPLTPRLSGVVA